MNGEPFFDTNILAYTFSEDPRRQVARGLLAAGGIISVQVLNELVAVLRRKIKFTWEEISKASNAIRNVCPRIIPVTLETHDAALRIAKRHGYHIFDSLIIASAIEARCRTLYSEDMHNGQVIEGITIRNPFASKS